MLDIYLLIVPFIGLLILLALIVLKYTLAQPKFDDLSQYQKKIQKEQYKNVKNQQAKNNEQVEQTGFRKTAKYLLKNYTLTQFYFIRRSRNKIPLLLSISIMTLMSYLINLPYVFSMIGGIITIIYAFGKMLSNQHQSNKNNETVNPIYAKEKQNIKNKLELIFTCVTLGLDIVLLGLFYKNYRNTMLLETSINLIINLVLDNCVVKPILLIIFALPIRNIQFVEEFINYQIQIVEILHQIRVMNKRSLFISAKSPKRHQMSPSKVPKAFLQVEPRVISQQKQKYLSTFQLNKGIRKQKLSPLSLRKSTHPNQQGNCSLMSIFNSNQKNKIKKQNDDQFDMDRKQQICNQNNKKNVYFEQSSKFSFQNRKKNKLYSSKMVLINPDNSIINGLDVENQQQQDFKPSLICSSNYKMQKSQKSIKDNDSKVIRNNQLLLISLNNCNNNEQVKMGQQNINIDNQQQFNSINKVASSLEDQSMIGPSSIQTSRKIGLLKIHQDKNGQDLQQIDLNSPERRRQQQNIEADQDNKEKGKKKKPHKKHSLDPNRYVIKHTTGEPYLQFLPNLLKQQREQKKRRSQQYSQQQFSRKIDIINNDSRFSKSVKRTKHSKDPIVRQNDENRIPEFVVEDYEE